MCVCVCVCVYIVCVCLCVCVCVCAYQAFGILLLRFLSLTWSMFQI